MVGSRNEDNYDSSDEFEDQDFFTGLIGTTDKGKHLYIRHIDGYPLYKVEFRPGGELPEELEGMFLTYADAEKAGKAYLNSRVKKNAKTDGN